MNLRFTLFASALLLLSACSKFENGPNVSFRTPEERIMGEWLATSPNVTEVFEILELRVEFLEEQMIITQVELDGDIDVDDSYDWRISGDNLEILEYYGDDEVEAVAGIVWLSNKRMTWRLTEDFGAADIEVEFEKQ